MLNIHRVRSPADEPISLYNFARVIPSVKMNTLQSLSGVLNG
jgi:hypothetical protein